MRLIIQNKTDNILKNDYSKSFLDNISNNINNILDNTIIFNNSTLIEDKESFNTLEGMSNKDSIMETHNKSSNDFKKSSNKVFSKTDDFNEATNKNNKYSGNNVKFNDANGYDAIGYVTEKGYYKNYGYFNDKNEMNKIFDDFKNTSGKNGCPILGNSIEINKSFNGYKPGDVIPTNPVLIVGTPMQKGQNCGNEGKNIQVTTNESENSPFTYVGCYAPELNDMKEQTDLDNEASFTNCKTRAYDSGSTVFAIGKGEQKCYTGNNLNSAKSKGFATKRKVLFKLLSNDVYKNQKIKGGLMKNGQIGLGPISGGINDWKKTRFTANPTCDRELGAFINTTDTIASYGDNCDGRFRWF